MAPDEWATGHTAELCRQLEIPDDVWTPGHIDELSAAEELTKVVRDGAVNRAVDDEPPNALYHLVNGYQANLNLDVPRSKALAMGQQALADVATALKPRVDRRGIETYRGGARALAELIKDGRCEMPREPSELIERIEEQIAGVSRRGPGRPPDVGGKVEQFVARVHEAGQISRKQLVREGFGNPTDLYNKAKERCPDEVRKCVVGEDELVGYESCKTE